MYEDIYEEDDFGELIGEFSNGESSFEPTYHAEELYRERNGSYTLITTDGPCAKYTGVYPLSEDEANEWMAEYEKHKKSDCSN